MPVEVAMLSCVASLFAEHDASERLQAHLDATLRIGGTSGWLSCVASPFEERDASEWLHAKRRWPTCNCFEINAYISSPAAFCILLDSQSVYATLPMLGELGWLSGVAGPFAERDASEWREERRPATRRWPTCNCFVINADISPAAAFANMLVFLPLDATLPMRGTLRFLSCVAALFAEDDGSEGPHATWR
jgi:hypothetical protein